MKENQITVTFQGMDSSDAMKSYMFEKLDKFDNFMEKVISSEVIFTENVHNKGVATDFKVEIIANVPKTRIYVEEVGENMYALIDKATDVFGRRIKRYFDMLNKWEGKEPWKYLEAEAQFNETDDNNVTEESGVTTYIPKISLRRKIDEMRPMEEAEAIEMMELSGKKQILFRNSETDKYSMIYKLDNGNYVLEEPEDELTV